MNRDATITHFSFDARDGYPLAGTLFTPSRPPLAAVLISSATAVPQRYYAAYARFLAAQGFVVMTYDYRGIAGSRWPAIEQPMALRMRDWGRFDMSAALDVLEERAPGLPVLSVGHSVGGQLLGFAPNRHRVRAALGVAAQSGYWGHWDGVARLRMLFNWYLAIPLTATLFGKLPAWVSGWELPGGIARQWAFWGRHPHYFSDRNGRPLHEGFAAYDGPMRLIAIGDDHDFAPRRAVEALGRIYRRAQVEVQILQPADYGRTRIGHFGFFREDMPKAAWLETAHWLRAQVQMPVPMAA